MSLHRALIAEVGKLTSLPAVWVGFAVTVVGTAGITVLNAVQTVAAAKAGHPERYGSASVFETAYAAAPLGTAGAIVIGVVAVSSEYTANTPDTGGGRQIGTTLTAIPGRLGLITAKAAAAAMFMVVAAAVALPLCIGIARVVLGDAAVETLTLGQALDRGVGASVYWLLMGLLAFGITLLTRGGTIPLLVLILNSSVVSVSLLLSKLTSLALWLPDTAGRNLFGFTGDSVLPGGLDPVPGGMVMAGWAAALIVCGSIAFTRRDA